MKKVTMLLSFVCLATVLSAKMPAQPHHGKPGFVKKNLFGNVDITVDFTGYDTGNVVTIVDSKGKTVIFNSANGLIQTKKVKVDASYTITWSITVPQPTSESVLMFYAPGETMVFLNDTNTETRVVSQISDISFSIQGR